VEQCANKPPEDFNPFKRISDLLKQHFATDVFKAQLIVDNQQLKTLMHNPQQFFACFHPLLFLSVASNRLADFRV
jgi:hypothetical protein